MTIDWEIEEEHPLDQLEDLIDDLPIENPNKLQLYRLYGVFLEDFVRNPILIKGELLRYNTAISKMPLTKGKPKGYEHIITRENKYTKMREFDRERANKIHWIKPIIEYKEDSRIKYFEQVNSEGYNQQFYYYKKKGFIVIIRELEPNYLMITAFSVDTHEGEKYNRWYKEYEEKR